MKNLILVSAMNYTTGLFDIGIEIIKNNNGYYYKDESQKIKKLF
jgi:hypothetical protein